MKRITKVVMNKLAKDFSDYIEHEFKDIRYMSYNPYGDFFTFQKTGKNGYIESNQTDDNYIKSIVSDLKGMMKNIKKEYPQISKFDMWYFAKGENDTEHNEFTLVTTVNYNIHCAYVKF